MASGCSRYEINTEQSCSKSVVVSVIVPVYNVEHYLKQCLDSIISQTFSSIEIICVDDGSTDRSGELLDKYAEIDSRIVVIHKENGGLSSARNAALSCVKGKYVCFVDSDDWLEGNAIEEMVSYMAGEIDIVVAGIHIDDEGGDSAERIEELKKIYPAKFNGIVPLDDSFINKVTIVVMGKLFKCEIIKKYGLLFLDGYKYEDNHFTVEYLVHSKSVFFVYKNLYHYVRRKNSITNSEFNYRDILYIFDHLYRRLDGFNLLSKYKKTISMRYSDHLRIAYGRSLPCFRKDIMKLATDLAQNYNPIFFNSDLVLHIQRKEYGLIPQFDKDVLIILKTTLDAYANAFKTIKSLFAQSYKLPKVMLLFEEADIVAKEDLLKNAPNELANRFDKELFIESSSTCSISVIKQKFQDYVLVTVESGKTYSPKWLRCVMAAFSDNKAAYNCLTFDNFDSLNDEVLFKDYSVIDIDSSEKVTVLKSKQIIVSVTSYPARINSVTLALETIYEQTRKPDKVVLWLAKTQFPNRDEDLPKELLKLVSEKGLEIQWCDDDLKPHKKYYYAFQKYPDDLIVTIDDDILYPPQRIENLYLSYLLHPYAVSAARAHLIAISETRTILPYKLWPRDIDAYLDRPSMQLCATGAGGVLYPAILFSKKKELFDKDAIKRTCLYADELWLKAMELMAGIPLVVAEEFQDLCYTPDSQDVGLWHENIDGGENDRQLLQIQEEIDRRYGKDTFCKKLLDTTIGENLVGAEALSNLIKFYKGRVKKQENQVKQQYAKYSTLRIDVRNKGFQGSNVIEKSVIPTPISLRRPDWLKDGIKVESEAGTMQLVLECKGDGELEVDLMGRDVRNANGMRYPVWIDCTYFAVNGEVVFEDTKTVCHDKRYVYRRKVADGEIVTLDMCWSECQSSSVLDEYRQMQTYLNQANAKVSTTEAALRNANAKISAAEAALQKAKKQTEQVKQQYSKYSTLRVDIRNKGVEGSTVLEQSVIPAPVSLRRPDWLKDGITVESEAETMQLVLECQGDGELEVDLMGRDVRNADGMRYPVWIDCTYFAVNGEAVFEDTKTVCHDKRYVYRQKVADGEIVTLDMCWSECQSSSVLDEYRQLQKNLNQANTKLSAVEAALRNANAKVSTAEVALRNANAKVSTTEAALRNANAKVSTTEAALRNANAKVSTTEAALRNANAKISVAEAALQKAKKQTAQVKQQYSKYSTLRVDIRNKGVEGSTVLEQSVIPAPVSLRRPDWLKDGITVESEAETMQLVLECKGDGELEVDLMGRDVRNADGMRYPVWIDCTYFAINGEVVFEDTKTVCHDKRYVYRRKVADGEIVTLDMCWSECQSSSMLDEYRQLQRDLKHANAKVSTTEAALRNANAKVSTTEAALRNANNVITSSKKQILATKEDNKRLKMQINSLKESVSFKIGRVLTWLPRKLRGGANCLKQNGLSYTVKRAIEQLGIDMGIKDSKKK